MALYNLSMFRAALYTLLVASLPLYLQAQRTSGMSSARSGPGAIHSNVGGHNLPGGSNSHGFVQGRARVHGHSQRNGFGIGAFPYFLPDYESGWPEQGDTQEVTSEPPVVQVREPNPPREPERPLPAQVIEIPSASKPADVKPMPATIFVLTNGEKVEAQRYLLTASSLSVTVQRNQRTIPVQMLDLDATEAANRDRGIDLRIPSDRNEISLRF